MENEANMIQAVINTLQTIDIKATYDNLNHLMGIYKTLADLRTALQEKTEVSENGNADSE